MTSDREKWVRVVAKLLEETQLGNIVWAEVKQAIPVGRRSFLTTYRGQDLRLDEIGFNKKLESAGIFGQSVDDYAVLSLVDSQGRTVYAAPTVEGLNNLFDAVLRRRANVDEFLNRALAVE